MTTPAHGYLHHADNNSADEGLSPTSSLTDPWPDDDDETYTPADPVTDEKDFPNVPKWRHRRKNVAVKLGKSTRPERAPAKRERSLSILSLEESIKMTAAASDLPPMSEVNADTSDQVQADDGFFIAENHCGDDYGEIQYRYETEYEAREAEFTHDGVETARRQLFRVPEPRCSDSESSSDKGEFDDLLDSLLPSTARAHETTRDCLVQIPKERTGHALRSLRERRPSYDARCVSFEDRGAQVAVYFGGRFQGDSHCTAGTNGIFEWCRDAWAEASFVPLHPPPRYGHAMAKVENMAGEPWVYVYGGRDSHRVHSDIWRFTPLSHRTYRVERVTPLVNTANGLVWHSMVPNGTGLFVFGGMGNDGECTAAVHMFQTESLTWHTITDSGQHRDDSAPSPRCDHAADVVDNAMFIFGGRKTSLHFPSNVEVFGDLWQLDLTTFRWTEIVTFAFTPLPRFGHTLHATQEALYVVGGETSCGSTDPDGLQVHEFSLVDYRWGQLRFPLVQSKAALLYPSRHTSCLQGGTLLVMGGGRPRVGQRALTEMDEHGPGWYPDPYRVQLSGYSLSYFCAMYVLQNQIPYTRALPNEAQGVKRKRPSGGAYRLAKIARDEGLAS